MRERSEIGLYCKDEGGYVTIACDVCLLLCCDKLKFFMNFEPLVFLYL